MEFAPCIWFRTRSVAIADLWCQYLFVKSTQGKGRVYFIHIDVKISFMFSLYSKLFIILGLYSRLFIVLRLYSRLFIVLGLVNQWLIKVNL